MDIYKLKELTPAQKEIIKASVPVLKGSGVILTKSFYQRMLACEPSVRPFFNISDQKSMKQPKILAFALLKYAENIDDLSPLHEFVHQIVVKHVGLQVRAEHYPIVGSNLLATMKELLADLATEEFMEAWEVAYGNLAYLLINAESELYKKNEWQGFREFVVSEISEESSNVKSVYLKPKDGLPIMQPLRGQYICIRWKIPGNEDLISREYSLSQYPKDNAYRISVKLLEKGLVSGFIHSYLKVGDIVGVAPPSGDFVYDKSNEEHPLLILAGGIGITPLISIIEEALKEGRTVHFLYSNNSSNARPFKTWLQVQKNKHPEKFNLIEYFTKKEEDVNESIDKVFNRRVCLADLVDLPQNVDIYLLGPQLYMKTIREYLNEVFNRPLIRSENFGPTEI